VPTGPLHKHYKDGVLFITYSLLSSKRAGGGGKGGRKVCEWEQRVSHIYTFT
jgi:hypothetical protein